MKRADDEGLAIDRLLEGAGEQWRATVYPQRDIDPIWFQERSAWSTRVLKGLGVAAVATAILAVVAVTELVPGRDSRPGGSGIAVAPGTNVAPPSPTVGSVETRVPRTPPTSPSSSATSTVPTLEIVSVGDRVSAYGHILARDGDVELCPGYVFAGFNPGCEAFIRLNDVDERSLPGHDLGDWWVTGHYTVEGTWLGDAIRVSSLELSREPDEPSTVKDAPCAEPEDGWPGIWPNDGAVELLQEQINEHPDLYAGTWDGRILNDDEIDTAKVVGTVGDVQASYGELSRIFPYNLCVVPVEFSATELSRASDSVKSAGDESLVTIDPSVDRVLVTAVVFDQPLAAAVTPYAEMVVVRTLVQPLT